MGMSNSQRFQQFMLFVRTNLRLPVEDVDRNVENITHLMQIYYQIRGGKWMHYLAEMDELVALFGVKTVFNERIADMLQEGGEKARQAIILQQRQKRLERNGRYRRLKKTVKKLSPIPDGLNFFISLF